MRDAIGGSVNLVIIVVFMLLVSGYLAFNINYTKAFKVKNKIISAYEEYDGACTKTSGTNCYAQIKGYMEEIGYNVRPMTKNDIDGYYENNVGGTGVTSECGSNLSSLNKSTTNFCSYCPDGDYCAIRVVDARKVATGDVYYDVHYKIVTRVNMDIPIINKVLSGLSFFQVSGDTKKIRLKRVN